MALEWIQDMIGFEMKKVLEDLQYGVVEEYGSSRREDEEEVLKKAAVDKAKSSIWPYRTRLTTDELRWDSLKISKPKEFENEIVRNMSERRKRDLEEMIPVEICINDVDVCESYKVKLVKKEAFWFEALPVVGEKITRKKEMRERKEFAYSIEPFRHIVKKRNLDYQQEIGLRWSGNKTTDCFDFSVLSSPRLSLYNLMI